MAATLPYILRETSSGIHSYRIQDEMLRRREIQCTGPIDDSAADDLCLQLRYLQQADPAGEITIYINSPGGSVLSGLAIYDVMKAISCPVRTVCLGMAASMGAFLLSSGAKGKRLVLPNAEIMIHQPSAGTQGQITDMAIHLKRLETIKKRMNRIMAENTGRSVEEVTAACERDNFMSAEEALEFGLVDQIITARK